MGTDTVRLIDSITLSTGGDPVPLRQGELALRSEHGQLVDATLTFHGGTALWDRIQAEGLFGYTADSAGPVFGGGFDADRPVRVELRPTGDVLTLLALADDDPMGRGLALLDAAPDSLLRRHDSYQLLTVTQERGGVRVGMSTDAVGLHG